MAIEFENPLTAGTVLVREAIQSQNYVAGSSGWIIEADGDAEFNNLTIRGTFRGTDFILNEEGLFFYDGTPANGNLIGSWASNSGTDEFGNAFPQGLSIGSEITRQIVLDYNGSDARVSFSVNNGHGASSGTLVEAILNEGAANEYLSMQAIGPAVVGHTDKMTLALQSQNLDGTSDANMAISHTTAGQLMTIDPVEIHTTVPITTYDSNTFTLYTPTVNGAGTATFTQRTGWYQRIGKMIFFNAFVVLNAAGSGASNVTISAPTSINRTTRQVVVGHIDNTSAVNGSAELIAFISGSGTTFDRIRSSTGVNITGVDLDNTGGSTTLSFSGWYREA